MVVGGGVAANTALRRALETVSKNYPTMKLFLSPLWLTGDNAAMIAHLGHSYLEIGQRSGLDMNGIPDWPLFERGDADER